MADFTNSATLLIGIGDRCLVYPQHNALEMTTSKSLENHSSQDIHNDMQNKLAFLTTLAHDQPGT